MNMGFGYDSDEGRALCGALTALMTGVAYATSAEMADELGPFAGYKRNANICCASSRNHRHAAWSKPPVMTSSTSTRCRSIVPMPRFDPC